MATPLINSKTKNFRLKGSYSLGGRSSSTNTSPIPLNLELAFNRKEIPGRTYKDIVDQALKTSSPNTYAYNQLLRAQSSAISRIQDEEDKAITEGRKLRKLQAQYDASTTRGRTAQDAYNLHNFWYNEAQKASQEGDADYALQALINANAAKDQYYTRSTAEANKAKSLNKGAAQKLQNELDKNKQDLKDTLGALQKSYSKGEIDGNKYDQGLITAYNIAINGDTNHFGNKDILDYLNNLKDNGIETIGKTDIDSLITRISTDLNGVTDEFGNSKGGLLNTVSDIQDRLSQPGNFKDVLTIDSKTGRPKLERTFDNGDIQGTNSFVQDEFGRWLPVTRSESKDADGKKTYTYRVQTIDAKGHIITRESAPSYDEAATPVFLKDNRPILEKEGRIALVSGAHTPETPQAQTQGFGQKALGVAGKALSSAVNAPLIGKFANLLNQPQKDQGSEPNLARNLDFAKLSNGQQISIPKQLPPLTQQGKGQFPIALPPSVPTINQLPPTAKITPSGQLSYTPPPIAGPINPAAQALANDIKNWPKGFTFPSFVEKYAKQLSLPTIYDTYKLSAPPSYGPPKESYQQVAARYTAAGGKL